jgi:hypothetical protein
MTDERLEALSDRVRRGQPIGLGEAIEVIAYQEAIKARRKRRSWWARFIGLVGIR